MAGNGGMKPTYGPVTDNEHLTEGGNKTLINGQECEAIRATYEQMEARAVDSTWNGVEDDSHVQGIYREQDFAGS